MKILNYRTDPFSLFYERSGVSLSAGTNILTAVYRGPAFTNTAMVATSIAEVVVGATAYSHDANGNLTGDANFAYLYDAQNRLTNIARKADGVSILANRYDGTGRRVEAVRETGTERYVYFPGSFLVLAVLDGSSNVKEVFTHGPDLSGSLGGAGGIGGILAQTAGTAGPDTHYLHPDAMGNVVMTTDASGQTSSTVHYGPFGRILARSGGFQSRYLFSSKEWEAAAGLSYYGYRFYSPAMGRWLSRDPIKEQGGMNLYAYVHNSPLNKVDALGLFGNPVCGPDGCYYPPDPCWGNCPPPQGISEPCASGFCVVGTTVDTCYGGFLQSLGIDHVDVTYNGGVVFVGLGGNVDRMGQQYVDVNHKYPLSKRESGTFQWGKKKSCPCKGATDSDILDCLGAARPPSSYNCQGSAQAAVDGCCLSGFRTLVSTCFPTW